MSSHPLGLPAPQTPGLPSGDPAFEGGAFGEAPFGQQLAGAPFASPPRPAEDPLIEALLRHLDVQLTSARRLLEAVERQGEAVRARDVERVLGELCTIQAELERRATLEQQRGAILAQAGMTLGVAAIEVTLGAILTLATPTGAALARERSTALRQLLAEVEDRHATNRALMRQELAFLDHLTRTVGGSASGGYQPDGSPPVALNPVSPERRVLDLTA